MSNGPFTIAQMRPIRPEMTISRPAGLGERCGVTWFSLGAGTSITPESYDTACLYIGAAGEGALALDEDFHEVLFCEGDLIYVPAGMLCGARTDTGSVYTEIVTREEITMNSMVKAGEALALKDLISYEEGSIANLDVAHTDSMKFVLMAFDEGTGLTPHRAPGNAIVTALEGKAIIGYEGVDYELEAGQSFRFEKNGLHSVTAQGQFKMSLLLVLE